MSNAIIAHGNLIDSSALSGGSWLPALPITNLQDRRLGKVSRSYDASTGSTKFDIDLNATRLIRVVSLVNHNFSLSAQYRIRSSTVDDFSSTVDDSGWIDAWPVVYPFGSLPWGSPSWWGGQISSEVAASYRAPIVYVLPQSTNARYVRVEIADSTNSVGYVQIGRCFVADAWQPVRNMVYGASLAWENRSEVQESLGGAEFYNNKASPRVVRISFENMSEDGRCLLHSRFSAPSAPPRRCSSSGILMIQPTLCAENSLAGSGRFLRSRTLAQTAGEPHLR